jgi:hypothetical protein
MCAFHGPPAARFSEALREAFTPERLDELLYFGLGRRRSDITMAGDNQHRVYDIIRAADAEGWLAELVTVAREARPGSRALHEVATGLGLTAVTNQLELLIRADVPDLDVSAWAARLAALESQVCRVEIGQRLGTGFLVGPDLCMTNHHVIASLLSDPSRAGAAILRFDHRRLADGSTVLPGTEHRLAEDWLVFAAPPSQADESDSPRLPAGDELDVALLRLAEPVGALPARRTARVGDAAPRGWVSSIVDDPPLPDSPLVILQHPGGEPMRLALGSVLATNANGTRIRHSVNTAKGSSGAPCLDAALRVVGLHHAGDPGYGPARYNAAVPVGAIRRLLSTRCPDVQAFGPGGAGPWQADTVQLPVQTQ